MPTVRTITVNLAKLSGAVTARWYDPSSGNYVSITGSPFANTGTRTFTPSGNNADGDGGWVLVLESGTTAPIPLNIQVTGGQIVLSWSNPIFVLQAAPAAAGTYTNVPGATSPYTNNLTGSQMVFRLQTTN
jgi:hypothetical protein